MQLSDNLDEICFGDFRFDLRRRRLQHDGEPVELVGRALDILRLLALAEGAVVSKNELMARLWPGRMVAENNLHVHISALRKALDRHDGANTYVVTVPSRGYRLAHLSIPEAARVTSATLHRRLPEPSIEVLPFPNLSGNPPPTPQTSPDRRQITAMSCELIGISWEADVIGIEDLRDVVAAFQGRVSETVDRHGGIVVRRLGNSTLGLFGYPVAHEYAAERAVRAGLELCVAVRNPTQNADLPMRCRVGIATGTVIIGDLGRDGAHQDCEIIGDAPNLAGCLQASIQPDIVAIDPVTRRLIGNLFDCRDLGTIDRTRGTKPLQIWQVLEGNAIANRFEALRGLVLSPLVGRDEEIDVLLRLWESAKAGDGQVVLLSAESGRRP